MMYDLIFDFLLLLTLGGSAFSTLNVMKRKSFHDSFNVCPGFGGGKDGGGGGGYSPPPAPDPEATAAAQGRQDRITAQTNALLLNPAIVNPYGRISYDTNSYTIPGVTTPGRGDAPGTTSGGETVTRPTQTTTLSPEQQQQYDLRNQVLGTLGNLGVNWANAFQTSKSPQYNTANIPTSIDYRDVAPVGNMADYDQDRLNVQKSIYNQQLALMQPQFDQQRQFMEDRLINSGNPMGSEAYNTQMGNYMRNYSSALQNLADQSVTQGYNVQNQLYNNANLNRQNQIQAAQLPYQTQSALAADQFGREQAQTNQNINALAALLQGGQAIQNPTLPVGAQYNQSALRSPDLMGMTQANYANQLRSYDQMYGQQQAQNYASGNALTSGLFSLGSSIAPLFF